MSGDIEHVALKVKKTLNNETKKCEVTFEKLLGTIKSARQRVSSLGHKIPSLVTCDCMVCEELLGKKSALGSQLSD